jgi:hypothetical protein
LFLELLTEIVASPPDSPLHAVENQSEGSAEDGGAPDSAAGSAADFPLMQHGSNGTKKLASDGKTSYIFLTKV